MLKLSDNNSAFRHTIWTCECSCGIIKDVDGFNLRNDISKSCGHGNKTLNIEGDTYGHLTVIEKTNSKNKQGI